MSLDESYPSRVSSPLRLTFLPNLSSLQTFEGWRSCSRHAHASRFRGRGYFLDRMGRARARGGDFALTGRRI
jgi:hypothetical protein